MNKPDKLKRLPRGISAVEIEVCLAEFLDFRKNIIVPRVERGASIHECDLLMLRPTLYATEFEIKITRSDLAKDLHKLHTHESDKVKEFYYALPMELVSTALATVPKSAGIIGVVRKGDTTLECKEVRPAVHNKNARKWTEAEQYQLARLGCMRWPKLKKENIALLRERGR